MSKLPTKKQCIKKGIIWGITSCILATFIFNPLLGVAMPTSIAKIVVSFVVWIICGIGFGLTIYKSEKKKGNKLENE